MKLFQMHQCAMTFWPEMTLRPKIILSNLKWLLGKKKGNKAEWLLSQKIAFQPTMYTLVKFDCGFLARNALLLKVLKGLARL